MSRLLLLSVVALSACTEARIGSVCREACQRAEVCDDETNVDQCRESCEDEVSQCNADSLDATLDDLDRCGDESCDDFTGCVVGAYLECNF
tara:strand:- start:58 stop:330 length:273 start_codon:yes stop_codon:yes gene_type:complete